MAASGKIARVRQDLESKPRRWLVSGAAGFIGSHLVEELLTLGQDVCGLDNLSTGSLKNLADVEERVGKSAWKRWRWIEGDICDPKTCEAALTDVDFVLHQAALGSVPRSIEDPLGTDRANVVGFLTILQASIAAGVERFVYASSSSVYGDITDAVKTESRTGNPLSPYASSKRADEIYAHSFALAYGVSCVGLRYFNVFGPRQNPDGPYAAVIPRWIDCMLRGEICTIFGDGETTRDYCYVANAVQANLLAAVHSEPITHAVFNAACGATTSLNELHRILAAEMKSVFGLGAMPEPELAPFRSGDVRNSLADISLAQNVLGYAPTHQLEEGVRLLAGYLKGVDYLKGLAISKA